MNGEKTQIVDWKRGELRAAPTPSYPTRRDTMYPVTCTVCSEIEGRPVVRWLRGHDARKAEQNNRCGVCQRREAGKAGYAAIVSKYSLGVVRELISRKNIQRRRLTRSSLEVVTDPVIMSAAERYDLHFETECLVMTKASKARRKHYVVDYMLYGDNGMRLAIEVNGRFVHERKEVQIRFKRKLTLLKRRGIPALVLWEEDIKAGRAEALVFQFIEQHQIEAVGV